VLGKRNVDQFSRGSEMPGLAFDALDRHIILGHAERVCVTHNDKSITFVEMLEYTASLAGGLRRIGVGHDQGLSVSVADPWERLSVVLALVRLTLVPDPSASLLMTGAPSVLRIGEDDLDMAMLIKIGRVDPASAPSHPDEHLLADMIESDALWIETLLAGRVIDLG